MGQFIFLLPQFYKYLFGKRNDRNESSADYQKNKHHFVYASAEKVSQRYGKQTEEKRKDVRNAVPNSRRVEHEYRNYQHREKRRAKNYEFFNFGKFFKHCGFPNLFCLF